MISISEKEELVDKLTNMLYNFYFKEKSENKVVLKLADKEVISVEKQSANNVTLREDIHRLLREYSTYLVSTFYPAFKDHEFNKKIEKLFAHEAVGSGMYMPSMASVSYGLIERYDGCLRLSEDIISVLKRFRYDRKSKSKTMSFPLMLAATDIDIPSIQ